MDPSPNSTDAARMGPIPKGNFASYSICLLYLFETLCRDGQIQIPGSHPSSQSVDYPTVGSMSLLLVTKHHVQSSQQQPNLIGLIR